MQLNWTIWVAFSAYVSGTFIQRIQAHEKTNSSKNTISSSSDDYDTNYPDYTAKDYPNLDYYDDNREGRSFYDHDNQANYENFNERNTEFMTKQLKSTIPGTPGVDYALHQSVPETSFRCDEQTSPGFYGDVEAQCQVFHICQEDDRQDSFLCPLGTVFNQISFICDWWFNFNCKDTPTFYYLNNKFDSAAGSTSVKDTMQKMNNFHRKEMRNIMDLTKVNMKIYKMRNMDSIKFSKSPVKNLFMLGMRNKKFESIRNRMTAKQNAENSVTILPMIRTPLALQAMSSTANFDIKLSDNATKISIDNLGEEPTPETTDYSPGNNNNNDVSTISTSRVLDNPLNLTVVEMLFNESASAKNKLDNIEIAYIETNTTMEPQFMTINTNAINETEVTPEADTLINNSTEKEFDSDFHSEFEFEYSPKLSTTLSLDEIVADDNSKPNPTPEKESRPVFLSLSKPFSHENKFIIGNDTHISVSVTIHSNSGNSKLLWKRLPGLKKIRKIRFKDENSTYPFEKHAFNDAVYRKKNSEQKSRSRIMWIPAKRNILDTRNLDWKSLLESEFMDAAGVSVNQTKDEQISEFNEAVFQNTDTSQIPSKEALYHGSDAEMVTKNNSLYIELPEESNTETDTSLVTTEESFQQFDKNGDLPNSSLEHLSGNQTSRENNSEIEINCKKICIKLLKSLNMTSSQKLTNRTYYKEFPSSMFLANESLYTQDQDDYNREGVLEFSPSEQWTLKYDSGPNCNENTENDKILVKGWSIIVDIGSITKEKTVKRRSCSNSSNDKRVVLKDLYFGKNLQNENAAFDPKTSHLEIDSNLRIQSPDQRYWINLVKNWLSQPGSNKELPQMKANEEQNFFPNSKQEVGENTNFKRSVPEDQLRSEYFHPNTSPQRDQAYFNPNIDYDFDTDVEKKSVKDSVDPIVIQNYNRRLQQNAQDFKSGWSPDLQTERSEWSQATQGKKSGLGIVLNNRNLNGYNTRDIISDETDEDGDRFAEKASKRSNIFQNSRRNRDFSQSDYRNSKRNSDMDNQWPDKSSPYADQDYDDWSSQERLSRRNWMNKRRDEEPHIKSEEWDAEPNNDWLNDKSEISKNNPRKDLKPNFENTTKDWLLRGKDKQGFDRNNQRSVPSQEDFDRKFSDGAQKSWSPNTMRNVKGRSMQTERNKPRNEPKANSMKGDQRNQWSGMKSPDAHWSRDKRVPSGNDKRPDTKRNKPALSSSNPRDEHYQTSKNNNKFQSRNDESRWRANSEPKWITGNQKGDKEWKTPAEDQVGDTGKNGWYTEENIWKWEEQENNKNTDKRWNLRNTSNRRNTSHRTNIKSDNVPDWSSRPKVNPNKGDAMKGKELPARTPQKHSGWMDDEDEWSAKSPKAGSWPSDHALNRMNFKGNSDFNSKKEGTVMTSQKSWNRNDRSRWRDNDEDIWAADDPDDETNHKVGENSSSKDRMKYPQWKSDFIDSGEWLKADDKRIRPQNKPSNSKGVQFPRGTSKNNNDRLDRTDWKNESWEDHITLSKHIKVEDGGTYQLHENRKYQQNGKTDTSSSPMYKQAHRTLSGYGRSSQKPNMNNYWGSSKDIKGSAVPESSSPNDNSQRKSAQPRKSNGKNENDSDVKNIVWSLQISSDGKLANGWVPITLRPDLKSRANRSQTSQGNKRTPLKGSDWDVKSYSSKYINTDDKLKSDIDRTRNDEEYSSKEEAWEARNFEKDRKWKHKRNSETAIRGSSQEDKKDNGWRDEDDFLSDESWNVKDLIIPSWNSELSKNNQNRQVSKHAEVIEINPLSMHTQEASFNHLIYIPPRNKKSKHPDKSKNRSIKVTNRAKRSYIIIKNGKILNGTSKNYTNRVFVPQPYVTVRNDKDYKSNDANSNITESSFSNATRATQNSSKFHLNESDTLKKTRTFRNDTMYETSAKYDTITTESVIREVWSSPLLRKNFSASGWIPVTTFRIFTNKNALDQNKNQKIINVTQFHAVTRELPLSTSANIQVKNFTTESIAENLPAKSYDTNEEITGNINVTSPVKSINVKNMIVGNKTLRILSFSDVMKHFQNNNKSSENQKSYNTLRNTPIIINPKEYALKLNNQEKEKLNNYNDFGLNLPANENKTIETPILINSGILDKNTKGDENPNTSNKGTDVAANIRDKLSSSTLSLSENKVYSNTMPENNFTNWNSNSDWTPVIRTIGRVVFYNRTSLL